ncbi:MAG: DUF2024 family protein [Mariprofundaceae bacterium]
MNIHVYDTYARSKDGRTLHFDVFIAERDDARALAAARAWLTTIGEDGDKLTQERCRFCHTQSASAEVRSVVAEQGYFILQMEGCPKPV